MTRGAEVVPEPPVLLPEPLPPTGPLPEPPLPEPPVGGRPLPEPPTGGRPLPEPPVGGRPLSDPPVGGRPLPEPPVGGRPLPPVIDGPPDPLEEELASTVILAMATPFAENFISIVKEKPFGEVTVTCLTAPFLIP